MLKLLLLTFACSVLAFPSMYVDRLMAERGVAFDAGPSPKVDPATLAKRQAEAAELVKRVISGPMSIPFSIPGLPANNLLGGKSLSLNLPGPAVPGRKIIPESLFQSPPPGAQRGGCPGLNIMSNYGFMGRDGITNAFEIVSATQEMLSYGYDNALFALAVALLCCIDRSSLKMSIGHRDSRTDGLLTPLLGGTMPGPFDADTHTQCEGDGSIARGDLGYYTDGRTDHFNQTYWQTARDVANANGGLYGIPWSAQLGYKRYVDCIATNPICDMDIRVINRYQERTLVHQLIPSSMPNGFASPATYDTVARFFGVTQDPNGTYILGDGHLPPLSAQDPNYYRRGVPLTLLELTGYSLQSYLQHPIVFGENAHGINSFVPNPVQLNQVQAPSYICQQIYTLAQAAPAGLGDIFTILLGPAKANAGC